MTKNEEEILRRLDDIEAELKKYRTYVAKSLNVQHSLTHSLKKSIMSIVGFIPGLNRITAIEMAKQITILNKYIVDIKKLMGFK